MPERRALLLRCRDGARFHLGETSLEDSSELLHADTLFSALAQIHARAFGAADEFVEAVGAGRLRFSSGLHVVAFGSRRIWFVPRPPLRYTTASDPTRTKRLRQIRYVSLALLREIGRGLEAPTDEDEVPTCGVDLLDGPRIGTAHACAADELEGLEGQTPDSFLRRLTRPQLDARVPGAEETTSIQFTPVPLPNGTALRGHFGVLLEHSLATAEWNRLLTCFRLLADEGVGGERSSGAGQFEEVEEITVPPFPTSAESGWVLGLAPTIPADDEEFRRAVRYELITRGGGSLGSYGDAASHRKRVRMIREGALYRGTVRGRIVDVSPERNPRSHPILRSGIHFPLPLEISV